MDLLGSPLHNHAASSKNEEAWGMTRLTTVRVSDFFFFSDSAGGMARARRSAVNECPNCPGLKLPSAFTPSRLFQHRKLHS